MKRLLAALVATLLLAPLGAQVRLTDYRRSVVAHSNELKAAAARTAAASETLGQARTGYLPRLSMEGDFSVAMRRRAGTERWTFGLLPQIVQTVYGGGSVRAAADRAALGYEIALRDEEFMQTEMLYAADRAYWNLSAARLYAEAMQRYVAIILSLKQVVDRRFDEGYIAKGDVLMIDARLSEARYGLTEAGQMAEVALHNFNVLRGDDPAGEVTLAGGIGDSIALPRRLSAAEALERRPDYAAARLRIDVAATDVRVARAAFNPQLSVGVGGSWKPDSPNRTGETHVDGSAFVRLSVPIFHGGERRRAVGAARARQLAAEWERVEAAEEIIRTEMNSWTAVVRSRAQIDASERNLAIARENLDLSTYSYGEGLATILDVMQAQLSWIQLYTNDIVARYNYAVAVSDYLRITVQE